VCPAVRLLSPTIMIAAACNRDLGYQCTCFTKLSKEQKVMITSLLLQCTMGQQSAQRLQSTLNYRPFLVSGLYVDRRLAASPYLGDKSVFGTSRACPSKGASLQVDIVVDFVSRWRDSDEPQRPTDGDMVEAVSRQQCLHYEPGNASSHGRANHGCIAVILLR